MENKKFCKFCGKEITKESIVCPHCGRQLEKIKKLEEKKENVKTEEIEKPQFYTQEWFMWLMLVLFAPIGIFLMWKFNDKMEKKLKIILTIVFGIFFIIIIAAGSSESVDDDTNDSATYDTNKKVTVEVVDFSTMTTAEIDSWCSEKKINCKITNEYSDTVEKGKYISQSVESSKSIYEGEKITIIFSLGKEPTISQKNALKKAQSYLKYTAFSRKGLIDQLEFEGFSKEDSIYGVDNVGADWNEQAVKKAKSYLDYSAFSRKGLIEQLEFEGFTHSQAVYGVEQNGL